MSVECRRLFISRENFEYADECISEARTRGVLLWTFPRTTDSQELICLTIEEARRLLPDEFGEKDINF